MKGEDNEMESDMKKIIRIILLGFFTIPLYPRTGNVSADCTLKGKKLYGNIQIVDIGEDVTIENATTGEDLKIEVVKTGAFRCGQWLFVNTGADLKVKFVHTNADIHIQFVTTGPGLNQ